MVYLLEKKDLKQNGNAPDVETSTLTKESPEPEVKDPTPIPLEIPPKALKLLQSLGVDLNPILGWAQGITMQVQAQGEAIELIGKTIELKLEPLSKLADQIEAARANPTPQTPAAPGGSTPVRSELGMVIQGLLQGGGDNPLQAKMNRFFDRVLDDAISKVGQPSKFEQYYDEEMAKLKAKVLAKSMIETT